MSTLHGILAELGIDPPEMHPEREIGNQAGWIVDPAFVPLPGHSYEIAFGNNSWEPVSPPIVRQVHIDAAAPNDWHDLETGVPLSSSLRERPIKACRPLD